MFEEPASKLVTTGPPTVLNACLKESQAAACGDEGMAVMMKGNP